MAKYEPNVKIPCVYMRGGTSKAVFFRDEDLPQDPKERDKVILSAFGSPDRRQIDGMGGAKAGNIASEMAVGAYVEELKNELRPQMTAKQLEKAARRALEYANEQVHDKSKMIILFFHYGHIP